MSSGKRHSKRSDWREKEVELDLEVVDEGDVVGVEQLGRHDVKLDLGKSLARTGTLAKAKWKNETEID